MSSPNLEFNNLTPSRSHQLSGSTQYWKYLSMGSKPFEPENHPFGAAVGRLVHEFNRLPGIGKKSAERLANHILSCSQRDALALAEAIKEVKHTIRRCKLCFNLTDQEECTICADPRRSRQQVCVVEQPTDVTVLEAAAAFRGTYHVLGGKIAPLEGISPDDLTIGPLVQRVRRDGVRELIMATNPTLEGDGTSLFISNLLADENLKITRLARGIATGSVLEFANKEMLADALRGRQSMSEPQLHED